MSCSSECSSSSISAPARSRSLVISKSNITVCTGVFESHIRAMIWSRIDSSVGVEYAFFDSDNEKAWDEEIFRDCSRTDVNCGCPGTLPSTLMRDSEARAMTRSRDIRAPIITPSSTPKIRTPPSAAMAVQNSTCLSRYNLRNAEILNRPRTATSTTAAKIGSGSLLKRPAKNITTKASMAPLIPLAN